jgi:nucleoside-diphosphate kinase
MRAFPTVPRPHPGVVAKLCRLDTGPGGPLSERNNMSDVTGVERTLVLLKPDAVARGLTGQVLTRFENALLKIVAVKMTLMDADLTRRHYFDLEERFGPDVYNAMAAFMQTGPVIALVLEGVDAIACTRKMVGSTYPDQAAPGTIRGDYAHMSKGYANDRKIAVANLVHASGNAEEAAAEIDVWFAKEEIHEYKSTAERYAR